MSNDKSRFSVFRSPLLWVALGLAVIFIGIGVETAAHTNPPVPPNHVRLTVNLNSGSVTLLESCNNCRENHGKGNIDPHDHGQVKVWLEFYPRNPDCVTINHNGIPIEVCFP